jgi:hypothetical protein
MPPTRTAKESTRSRIRTFVSACPRLLRAVQPRAPARSRSLVVVTVRAPDPPWGRRQRMRVRLRAMWLLMGPASSARVMAPLVAAIIAPPRPRPACSTARSTTARAGTAVGLVACMHVACGRTPMNCWFTPLPCPRWRTTHPALRALCHTLPTHMHPTCHGACTGAGALPNQALQVRQDVPGLCPETFWGSMHGEHGRVCMHAASLWGAPCGSAVPAGASHVHTPAGCSGGLLFFVPCCVSLQHIRTPQGGVGCAPTPSSSNEAGSPLLCHADQA